MVASVLTRYVPRNAAKVLDLNVASGRHLFYLPDSVREVVAFSPSLEPKLVKAQGVALPRAVPLHPALPVALPTVLLYLSSHLSRQKRGLRMPPVVQSKMYSACHHSLLFDVLPWCVPVPAVSAGVEVEFPNASSGPAPPPSAEAVLLAIRKMPAASFDAAVRGPTLPFLDSPPSTPSSLHASAQLLGLLAARAPGGHINGAPPWGTRAIRRHWLGPCVLSS